MTFAKLYSKVKLQCKNNPCFSGGFYDGVYYYFYSENKILKYTNNFELVDENALDNSYTCICYDNREDCFWASKDENCLFLYKLNYKFEEISNIRIHSNVNAAANIISFSYNKCDDTFIIITNLRIIKVNKKGEITKDIFEIKGKQINYSCNNVNENLVYMSKVNKTSFLGMNDKWNNKIIFRLPNTFIYTSILDISKNKNKIIITILAKDCKKNSFILKILIIMHNLKNFDNCLDEYRITLKNKLTSIDNIEKTIAKILDTESDKIIKAINLSNNTNELIELDKQVNKTIVNISSLENLLYSLYLDIAERNEEILNKIYKD